MKNKNWQPSQKPAGLWTIDCLPYLNKTPQEKSKTFTQLARIANCQEYLHYENKGTRRGLIAMKVLGYLESVRQKEEKLETEFFSLNCPKLL